MAELKQMRGNPRFRKGLIDLVETNFPDGKGLVAIEIGSYQGESTELFLSTGRFSRIYCIDAWTNGYDDMDGASFSAELAESAFDRRFERERRVIKMKGYSWELAWILQDGMADLLYIDGNHRGEAVAKDLELYAPKVRIGGVLAGHDYRHRPRYSGLVEAVDRFLGGRPEHVFCDYSWSSAKRCIETKNIGISDSF